MTYSNFRWNDQNQWKPVPRLIGIAVTNEHAPTLNILGILYMEAPHTHRNTRLRERPVHYVIVCRLFPLRQGYALAFLKRSLRRVET